MRVPCSSGGEEVEIAVPELCSPLLEVPCDDIALSPEMVTIIEDPIKLIGPMFRCLMAANALGMDGRTLDHYIFSSHRETQQ